MPLTTAERKHLMPYGAQKEVATEEGATEAYVSLAMNDEVHPKTEAGREKLRRVRVRIAGKLGITVDEAFSRPIQGAQPAAVATAS